MTHPGEQFYPEGVHWDDPLARGTLPDLLSKAAAEFAARPAIEFRDRAIGYTELEALVEVAAAAYLRAEEIHGMVGRVPEEQRHRRALAIAGAQISRRRDLDQRFQLGVTDGAVAEFDRRPRGEFGSGL